MNKNMSSTLKKIMNKNMNDNISVIKNLHLHQAGQIVMEAVCLVLFVCVFLTMLSILYETGQTEINKNRLSRYQNHGIIK